MNSLTHIGSVLLENLFAWLVYVVHVPKRDRVGNARIRRDAIPHGELATPRLTVRRVWPAKRKCM